MLERAGIDYLILEAAEEVRPQGTVVYLGPPVMRAFEQLGLYDDLIRQSHIMTGVTLVDHKLTKICRIKVDFTKERYGYNMLTIARPKLYSILLSRIPAYKILFSKRVVFASQTHEGVKVRCEDGSTVSGDILVAADGGASPIRTAMYEEIRKRCKKVPHPSDYSIPKLDQRVIVGVTEPQSTKQFPVLDSKNCELILMMPKESNCMVWFIPMAERRFGWGISSPLPSTARETSWKSSNGGRNVSESGIETPSSPASIHGMTRSFSAMSTTSYSPPSSASSSNIQTTSEGSDYFGSSTNGGPSSVRKRQSFGRLSKHSSNSNESQRPFQQYPTVLQLNEASTLEMKDLPTDRVWGKLDERFTVEDYLREQISPFGGTVGDLIDATSKKMICTAVVEEKFYHTWHFGRTLLLGDACHKLLPSSGHGTTQGILDAISLASLLADLPSNTPTDIDALFRLQYERRGPAAKAAVMASENQELLFNRKLSGKILRKLSSNWMSDWINTKLSDRLFDARPTLPFLKPVPERGYYANKDKSLPLLDDKRYEMARRKSISSGYLNGGTGSSKLGDHPMVDLDMEFHLPQPSASMPSSRPLSSLLDSANRSQDGSSVRDSHWYLYQD
ncbi:hypothetical protein BGX34_002523 [Mortierella sp. NVP85]|nr:hypothetical protein BGX34_002523 [Mortierella sp. NVP85]